MDRFAYLIDLQHRFLLLGIIFLIFAAVCTLSGDTIEPRSGMVDRAEEPRRFWENVVVWFALGVFFIGLYLYQRLS